jgi:hypothetical protein
MANFGGYAARVCHSVTYFVGLGIVQVFLAAEKTTERPSIWVR